MSGRVFFRSVRWLSRSSFALPIVLVLSERPAVAQSTADAPEAPLAPDAPAVAPPSADPPTPAPSEPAPPNQAPPITEPTPAATPTLPREAAAPQPEPPAGSAAFAPLPAATREIAKPKPAPASSPTEDAPSVGSRPVSHADYDEPAKHDDSGGLLGPFRIGVLVGTGLPEVVNFGAQLKLTRFIGLGVNVGLIPTVKVRYYGEAAQKYQEYDAYGHIYPFGGSFFLGAGVGYAQIDGTLVNRFNLAALNQPGVSGMVDVTSDASVRTLVLTPQIGFLKIFDVGFAIGIDIGAQIPIAPSEVKFNTVTVGIPQGLNDYVRTTYINPNDEKVRSTLNTLGRTPLPTFNFKIGWFL